MAIVKTNTNLSTLTIATGEQVEVKNGATLIINSTPTVLPGNLIITTSGKVRIENNSTTTPIRVPLSSMNADFRFEGNGILEVRGQQIEIGVGTGSVQAFNLGTLFSNVIDDLTYVQVETSVGSGVFENWVIIPIDPKYYHIGRADGSCAVAEILGSGYEAGKVAFWHETNKTLSFGNNINGWSVPIGSKIQIPNILITNDLTTDSSLVHAIVSEGVPTGGTFTITVTNRKTNTVLGTTTALPYNASSTAVDTELEVILGSGTITSSGGALPTGIVLTLAGASANTPLALTVNSGVTGGTNSVIYTRENSAANMTLLDLNPSGTLDTENCMFSQKIRCVNDAFSSVRIINCGFGGDTLQFNSSNGDVYIKNVTFTTSPYTLGTTGFQIASELGNVSLDGIRFSGRRSNTRIVVSAVSGLQKLDNSTSYCYASTSRLATNRESFNLQTVTNNLAFNNLVAIGGRFLMNNLTGNTFNNLKIADGHSDQQTSLSAVSGIQTNNSVNLKFLNTSMAGVMAHRNWVLTSDINSSGLEFFGLNYDCANNAIGIANVNGKNTNFSNCQVSNVRGGAFIDQPPTFTASGVKAKKVFNTFATPQLSAGLDVAQDGEYDLIGSTISGITESFASVENFVGGNYVDTSLTPTTGHVTFGPFGKGKGLTLTGASYTNQAGKIYFTNIGDTAEIEIPFAMHGITGFQNVIPSLLVELEGVVSTDHFIVNNEGINGGTFTLSVYDNLGTLLGTTPPQAWNVAFTALRDNIRVINPLINLSTVTGSLNTAFQIKLLGSAGNYFGSISVDGSLLTGGTNPNIAYAFGKTFLLGVNESMGTKNSLEFAVRTLNGSYGSYLLLNGLNLSNAISSLSGYSANDGLFMKLKFVSSVDNPYQFIQQISLPTNLDADLWILSDSFINIRGTEDTDIIEIVRVSDNIVLYTFTGGGAKDFLLGANYNESVYFIRRDNLNNILMSTIKNPINLTIGNNGIANLFYGSEIQLAESSTVGSISSDITNLSTQMDNIGSTVWNYGDNSSEGRMLSKGLFK